jgi:endonuclease G
MGRIDALRDIASDVALREEILSRVSDDQDLAERMLQTTQGPRRELEALGADAGITADRARAVIDDPPDRPEDLYTEAIVLLFGRPVLLVRNDDVDLTTLETDTWRQRLEHAQASVRAAIPSVGRIELRNHPRLDWVGTGWVVADDVIVTNRHVAEVFAHRGATGFTFRAVPPAVMEPRIDFNEERDAVTPAEIRVAEVLHIEDDDGPDIALLRVDWNGSVHPSQRRPISLARTIAEGHDIAVIGYPAKDSRTRIPDDMDRIFGDIYNVKRLAPGRLTRRADERGHENHDCTTLGGNSGSVVIDLESGDAVALHFAGRERDRNLAVPAPVVQAVLERLRPPAVVRPRPPEPALDLAADADRSGYDPAFLGPTVQHPDLTCGLADAVAPVIGTDDGILHYTHYSVRMHRFRRLAMYVAVNIDGRALRRVPRGSDNWRLDPRLDPQFQADNELYRHNNLDRGHLVRRLDPAWGDTFDDARVGARDTFFYTNCAPQHQLHNPRLWLGLEDHILDSAAAHELRASVFTGPIFRNDDRTYRSILLPEDFWKVVAIVDSETGRLSVTGYVVSQRDFMHDLEFVFGPYETYQVPVATIESQTGLVFGLTEFDPLGAVEGLAVRPQRTAADIVR